MTKEQMTKGQLRFKNKKSEWQKSEGISNPEVFYDLNGSYI